MSTIPRTTGLILAGGAGLRVRGRDKGLIPWCGMPLAAQVAARLRPQVDVLLVSCNRNLEEYAAFADATVCDTRRDFQGPLAGLEAAIPLITSEFVVISPCDTPLLPGDLARRLLDALDGADGGEADISYAHDGTRGHYLCAALRSHILPSLHTFLDGGQRAVRHWYEQHRCAVVDFSDSANCFSNHNYLE